MSDLKAIAFNCTLKGSESNEALSTEVLLRQLLDALKPLGVEGKIIRVVDHTIKPGVSADEGNGDASLRLRVLKRMDAFLGERDARERMPTCGKIAIAAVVSNEDGTHHAAHLARVLKDRPFPGKPQG